MSSPDHLHHLVSDLGDSLVQALAADAHCRELAYQIQAKGYSLVLILEASPAPVPPPEPRQEDDPGTEAPFSEDDRRLMQSFKIRMD